MPGLYHIAQKYLYILVPVTNKIQLQLNEGRLISQAGAFRLVTSHDVTWSAVFFQNTCGALRGSSLNKRNNAVFTHIPILAQPGVCHYTSRRNPIMTSKVQLDHLAQLCHECASQDEGSLDGHLSSCPICTEYSKKAEMFNQTLEVLQMMASKPEEERNRILGVRIQQFTTMSDEKRAMAVSGMLEALAELPIKDRIKIVKARTDIMTTLPRSQRDPLLESMAHIMGSWTEERKIIERQALFAATEDYFILKRVMLRKMFDRMMG